MFSVKTKRFIFHFTTFSKSIYYDNFTHFNFISNYCILVGCNRPFVPFQVQGLEKGNSINLRRGILHLKCCPKPNDTEAVQGHTQRHRDAFTSKYLQIQIQKQIQIRIRNRTKRNIRVKSQTSLKRQL